MKCESAFRGILLLIAACFALGGTAPAQTPPILTTGVESSSSNERTTLNRTTARLSSSVDLKIKNTSDRLLEPPLHVVITFTPAQGSTLDGLSTTGLAGGIGLAPYQTYYKDLSALIGSGLPVGAEATFGFTFDRPSITNLSYSVQVRGVRNADPVVVVGGPYSGQQNTPVSFDAGGSTDPEGEALTFAWDFGDGVTATGPTPQHAYAVPGRYTVRVTVTDPRLGNAFRETEVPISPPGVFALARTRTLDGNGHPLGDVAIAQTGPDGAAQFQSDGVSGFSSLGGQPGDHTWLFSKTGHLTVRRRATLEQGTVKVIAFPWLARLETQLTRLSLLNPTTVKSPSEKVALTVPPGAFEQIESVGITDLHGQNLPLPLPFGWSPLAAFHLDMPRAAAENIDASIRLSQNVSASQSVVVARHDADTLTWIAESVLTGNDSDTLAATLLKPGSYAVVIADTLTAGNPAAAVIGQPLPAGDAPAVVAEVTAVGSVDPATSLASTDPAKVTATATVRFTNGTQPLSSGAWFLADVEETYDLRDGSALKTPDYDATFYAYRILGDAEAPAATAVFPMRPRVLFRPDELVEAHIKADVRALDQFSGGIVTPDGGLLTLPGVKVAVPAGAVAAPSAAEARLLSITGLNRFLGGLQSLIAFELNLPRLAAGTEIGLALTNKQTANAHFVLARCVTTGSESGLQPVLRMASDAQGVVASAEPATGPRLPGITGSGQFVLVELTEPEALITGLVRKVGGALLPGAIVRLAREPSTELTPWMSLTDGAGAFGTLAKPGDRTVTAFDPADGNSGQAIANLADAAASANVEIQTGPTGPHVTSTTPKDGATKVNSTTPVVVRFSEPIDPASFGPLALTLTNPHGVRVIGSLSLNLAATAATFLSTEPLEQAAHYTIELAATIKDRTGLPIEGQRTFTFAVVPFFERPAGAQLVIYEPDAHNVPQSVLDQLVGYDPNAHTSMVVAAGTPGTADPDSLVILVNDNTGETANVTSGPDGSFANFINAAPDDFIKAVFVNANGTRVEVPATRQLFDDGRVGLYTQGGILEAQSDGGPVQVQIEPKAIDRRSVFKIDLVSVAQLADLTGGILPEGNQAALPGVNITVEGDAPKGNAEISMPLNPATLGLENGVPPESAAFALSVPVKVDDTVIYVTVDNMRYENGRLFTNTCPFKGVYDSKILDNMIQFAANLPGIAGTATGIGQMAIPILLSKASGGVTVNGSVAQLPISDVELIENAQLAELALLPLQLFGGRRFSALDLVGSPAALLEQVRTRGAVAVQGALIALRPDEEVFSGRIQPGMVCAVSDENGCYSLVAPALHDFKLVGTHPRLGRARDVNLTALDFLDIGTKAFLARNVFFGVPDEVASGLVPRILVNHAPLDPAVGQEVTLTIDAFTSASNMAEFRIAQGDATNVQTLILGQTVSRDEDLHITNQLTTTIEPGHRRFTAKVLADKSLLAKIRFFVEAERNRAYSVPGDEYIAFGFSRPIVTNALAPADPNDHEGPAVVGVTPQEGSYIYPGNPIAIRFSEPINLDVLDLPAPVGFNTATPLRPSMSLSADQQTLTVYPLDLPSSGTVMMTVGTAIHDISGNALRQTYHARFNVDLVDPRRIPDVESGGGSALDGYVLYVLDRGGGGKVRIYDAQNPAVITPISTILPLPGKQSAIDFPRDLVLIRDWSHVPGIEDFANEPEDFANKPAVTTPLLIVVGGTTGSVRIDDLGNSTDNGQYMTIYDVSNPRSPVLVQNVQITARPSTVPKIRWYPPELVYLENSADTHFVSFVNLQELLVGFSVPPATRATVFARGREGHDVNGDGSYDEAAGEQVPWPKADDVTEYFGFEQGIDVLPFPRQRTEDFDFNQGTLAVVRSMAGLSPPVPESARPEFRLLIANGQEVPETAGVVAFDVDARPKRVLLVPGVNVEDNGVQTQKKLAFVSLSPDSDGVQKLAVIDYTNTTTPVLVRRIAFDESFNIGTLQSPVLQADGTIALSATTKLILISPALAYQKADVAGQLHSSVIAIMPNGGSGNFSIGVNTEGARSVALGGRNEFTMAMPGISFVSFPGLSVVVQPEQLVATEDNRVFIQSTLKEMRETEFVRPARFKTASGAPSALSPPSPLVHYHVLIRAPGATGSSIPVLLESLNEAGKAESNKGKGYPPVRVADVSGMLLLGLMPDEQEASVVPLRAYRMSSNSNDPEFNLFLSDPFVVVREKMTKTEVDDVRRQAEVNGAALPIKRAVLWSESLVRATLDVATPSPISDFAVDTADSASGMYRPKVFALASTLPGSGKGGPPMGGELAVPGTFGTIEASSGEFRHSTVDLELPSPRMPIVFERTAATHAGISSAFGLHWDFNYNQRALEMRPELVPPGQREPVQERSEDGSRDVVARSKDVIFIDGAGHTLVFENKGTSPPPGVDNDPLVIGPSSELHWDTMGGEFYLPAASVLGVFDIMYRYPSGELMRVTPDGTQYLYRSDGKLSKVTDRYPLNYHLLDYNDRGELVKITDHSVQGDRYLKLGYWRKSMGDTAFDSTEVDPVEHTTVDLVTPNERHVGRICHLVDYAGRIITYEYDDKGMLKTRKGVAVAGDHFVFAGEAVNTFDGPPITTYQINQRTRAYVGVIAGSGAQSSGTSLVWAGLADGSEVAPQANSADGASGHVEIGIPADRTPANVATGSTTSGHADRSNTEIKFDDKGYPASINMTREGETPAPYTIENNERGLPHIVTFPEGNSVEYGYELDTAPFRARANVKSIKRKPGPRPGVEITSTFNYDYRYNLPSGEQMDFNGKTYTINLSSDGRDALNTVYPQSGTHSITRNSHGQVESETTVEGVVTTFGYGNPATGFATSRTMGADLTTQYDYNSSIAGKLGMPTTITPPRAEAAPIYITYNARQQQTQVQRGDQIERTGYDENGNIVFLSRALGDGADYKERRTWSQINFLEKIEVDGVEGGGGTLTTTFSADEVFRVKQITLPGGELRSFKYDHLGNVTEMTLGPAMVAGAGMAARTYKEEYGRDLHGNMTSLKKGGTEVQNVVFDGHDRPITITNKTRDEPGADETTNLTYFGGGELQTRAVTGPVWGMVADMVVNDVDEMGRPLSVTVNGTQTNATVTTDYRQNGGLTVTTTGPVDMSMSTAGHDSAGRPRTQTSNNSLLTVSLTPDANGNVEKIESMEDGNPPYTQDMRYNDLDQLTIRFDPVGTLMDASGSASLRFDGLPLSIKDGRDKVTTRSYSRLGELLSLDRPEQIRFAYSYDKNRQPVSVKDRSEKGNVSEHTDGTLRQTKTTWRNGSSTTFDDPDGRNLPQSIDIPDGSITATYDLQGRPTNLDTTYRGGDYHFKDATYDALGRLRFAKYGSDGQFSLDMGYDKLGPLTSCVYDEPGGPYTVSSTIREDGARATLKYPSGVTVTESREDNGRLTMVEVDFGSTKVWEATAFAGAELPRTVKHGTHITETCAYDERKRILARRYTGAGGTLLEDVRLEYDLADNVTARQLVVGGARTDFFQYDDADRLTFAEYGAHPRIPGAVREGFGLLGDPRFDKGWFARDYQYDSDGLDLLRHGMVVNPDALPLQPASSDSFAIPAFAAEIGDHDNFLFAHTVGGFSRGDPDALGNASKSRLLVRPVSGAPAFVAADLTYNGRSNLIRIARVGDVTIDCQYRPDNLMHHRKVTGGANPSETALVWHEGRLLEEYSLTGGTSRVLRARYYYADGDAPVAADLRQADDSLLRVHYLHDQVFSVVAVANDAGEVIERVRYDAWGQPVITARDTLPPQIAEVRQDGNSVLVTMSEPVLPLNPTTAGSSLVTGTTTSVDDAFRLTIDGNDVAPQVVFEEGMAPFGSVFRLSGFTIPINTVTLRTIPGKLQDASGNLLPDSSLIFTISPTPSSGNATVGSTISIIPRSAVGNPFLFQGQWFDYDAGLVYMRARHYDPFTGQFLQRDPMQYEDSVNLYAAFRNNAVNWRDPTGTISWSQLRPRVGRWFASASSRGRSWMAKGWQSMQSGGRLSRLASAPATRSEATRILRIVKQLPDGERITKSLTEIRGDELTVIDNTLGFKMRAFVNRTDNVASTNRLKILRSAEKYLNSMIDDLAVEPGFFDVIIHANATAASIKSGLLQKKWTDVPFHMIADEMLKAGYKQGQKIRLLACKGGANTAGLAMYLHQAFDADVIAPKGLAVISRAEDGGINVASRIETGLVRGERQFGPAPWVRYSNGTAEELDQMQYLRALLGRF